MAAASVVFSAPLFASACAGGGSSPGGGGIGVAPTQAPSHTAPVAITIHWPTPPSAASRRRPSYISSSTESVGIIVNGGAATYVNNPALSGTPVAATVTNVDAPAQPAPDTFSITSYDKAGGAGNILGQASVPQVIKLGAANIVDVTLNGNLGKIVCMAITPFVSGTSAMTLVGPAGQIALLPEDADGNIIVAPGAVPTLSLAAPSAASATVTTTSTPNLFNINVLTAGTPVALSGTGENLAGTAVAPATCNVTRVKALYVANQGAHLYDSPSVTIYPATASGDATPTATLVGSSTDEAEINFVAVDPKGNLFLSNQGPEPNATFGPTAGYVSIFGPAAGQSGNVAPIATIANLNTPEGLAFDSSNDLWVLSIDRIQEYPPSADGVTAAPSPSTTITGPNTGLNGLYGLDVGLDGTVYAAGTNFSSSCEIEIFAPGSSGNASETTIVPSAATTESWIGVAADSTGNMYATASQSNLNFVVSYAPQTSSGAPAASFVATGFSQPFGIFVDKSGATPTNAVWVANYANGSISYFSSTSTLALGEASATSTLSGTDTGLNYPFGVYVR
jgi:hypothetical protein